MWTISTFIICIGEEKQSFQVTVYKDFELEFLAVPTQRHPRADREGACGIREVQFFVVSLLAGFLIFFLDRAGKIKHIGLRSARLPPSDVHMQCIPSLQCKLNTRLYTLDIEFPEIELLKTCRELGIKIVAYSPLGRGILTGQIVSVQVSKLVRRLKYTYTFQDFGG